MGHPCRQARAQWWMTMATAFRYLNLTFFLSGVFLRRMLQYRIDFVLGAMGFVFTTLTRALFIYFVFGQVTSIRDWGYHQMLFLFGFSLIPRGLDHMFTDQLWELSRKLIQRGEFFKYLLRPINPLFHLLSERFFYADGIGETAAGVGITWYAAHHLTISMSPLRWIAAAGLVLCATLIYASIKLTFSALSFWMVSSLPSMNAVYQVSAFSKYPLDFFHPGLQFVLLWVVPFAFTAYVPARYLLNNDASLVLWTPAVSLACSLVAYQIWRKGLEHYEMTGS
jgi:ABC-2 type transport system permease protein